MRTTIDLDNDVLVLGKRLAAERGISLGRVVSDLARKALQPKARARRRNGVPLLRARPSAQRPTLELINRLRDSE